MKQQKIYMVFFNEIIVLVYLSVSNFAMSLVKYDNFCELTNQNIPYNRLTTTKTLRPRSCNVKEHNQL